MEAPATRAKRKREEEEKNLSPATVPAPAPAPIPTEVTWYTVRFPFGTYAYKKFELRSLNNQKLAEPRLNQNVKGLVDKQYYDGQIVGIGLEKPILSEERKSDQELEQDNKKIQAASEKNKDHLRSKQASATRAAIQLDKSDKSDNTNASASVDTSKARGKKGQELDLNMSEITTSKTKGKGSEKKEAASTTKGKHKVTQESELLESEPDDSKQVQEKKPDYLDNQGFDDNGGSSSPKKKKAEKAEKTDKPKKKGSDLKTLDVNAPTDVKQIISQVKSLENKVNAMQKEMEYLRAQSRLQSKVLHVNNQKFKALSVDYDVYVPQTSWTAAVGASTVGQAVAAVIDDLFDAQTLKLSCLELKQDSKGTEILDPAKVNALIDFCARFSKTPYDGKSIGVSVKEYLSMRCRKARSIK